MGKRATLPAGIKAFIDADVSDTPLIENYQNSTDQIGTGVAAANISDADSVMPITHTIGGKLTATGTIDLSNGINPSTGVAGEDATGKRILAAEFYVDPASTGTTNVAPGASNPYPIFGAANDFDLVPGMHLPISQRKKTDGTAPATRLPAVAGAVKTIDVTIVGTVNFFYLIELGD